MKLRVYVMAASADLAVARRAMAAVLAAGHEVTHDWTADVARYGSDAPDALVAERCAIDDLDGVARADVALAVDGPPSYGRTVELGAALGLGVPVVAWDRGGDLRRGRIWETRVEYRGSLEDAVACLPRVARRDARPAPGADPEAFLRRLLGALVRRGDAWRARARAYRNRLDRWALEEADRAVLEELRRGREVAA